MNATFPKPDLFKENYRKNSGFPVTNYPKNLFIVTRDILAKTEAGGL